jgi:hypothetical protein
MLTIAQVQIAVHLLQRPIACRIAGELGENRTSHKGALLHLGPQKSTDNHSQAIGIAKVLY